MPEVIGVTLRFPMQGLEEYQQKLVDVEQAFGDFWARMDKEAAQVEIAVKQAMSRAMYAINTVVTITLSMTKILGIYVDKQHEFLIRSTASFLTQLALAATAYATNPATLGLAVITSTAAFALEVQAQKLQQEQQLEASQAIGEMNRIGEQMASLMRQMKGVF